MKVFVVVEMYGYEVKDVRFYGNFRRASDDLTKNCDPNNDSLFEGSCVVSKEMNLASVKGQIITPKKTAASKKNAKNAGRPKGARDSVQRIRKGKID